MLARDCLFVCVVLLTMTSLISSVFAPFIIGQASSLSVPYHISYSIPFPKSLLFGSSDADETRNLEIINETVNFIKISKRLDWCSACIKSDIMSAYCVCVLFIHCMYSICHTLHLFVSIRTLVSPFACLDGNEYVEIIVQTTDVHDILK